MSTSRREWIQRIGMAAAGIGMAKISSYASPIAAASVFTTDEGIDRTIRLSSNENPYGPSPMAIMAMADTLQISNRYQWEMIRETIAAIAAHHHADKDNICIGAGSTQVIDNIIQLAAQQKGNFIVAEPTFSRWASAAENAGLKKISVPLTASKRNNLRAMLDAINSNTRFVYVCNPNNPTGTVCKRDQLISFIEEATKHTKVAVDEAYLDYAGERSLCQLAAKNKNLIVIRTFSKIYGLAGARIGYAMAHADTITQLTGMKSGANIDISAVSLAAAMASLKDMRFAEKSFSENARARTFTQQQLQKLGMKCIPSHTNFIYFSLANYGKDYFGLLRENNIEGTTIFEENGKWTRITVGTMHEMERFIEAIR